MVKTDLAVASGVSAERAEQLYSENPCMDPEDIADAVIYALGAPGHVQVLNSDLQAKLRYLSIVLFTGA
jgi:NADP-dependent 3-hydroxy acid dehydrogenase YdfG